VRSWLLALTVELRSFAEEFAPRIVAIAEELASRRPRRLNVT
jgi:hypothetical protein